MFRLSKDEETFQDYANASEQGKSQPERATRITKEIITIQVRGFIPPCIVVGGRQFWSPRALEIASL
jgi:hypothetical protein